MIYAATFTVSSALFSFVGAIEIYRASNINNVASLFIFVSMLEIAQTKK
jgi:hypothetical protein